MSVKVEEKNTVSSVLQTEESIRNGSGTVFYRVCKRCFDFVAAFVLGIILLIPMLLVALMIVMRDPGKPIYFQERLGKDGKLIKVAKFRSMKKNADKLEQMLTPEELEQYRKEYKLDQDPRLIGYKPGKNGKCFGELLRKGSVDELPQLWNILLGNMSFVGPRPILPDELEDNYTPDERRELLSVKPGLSGY